MGFGKRLFDGKAEFSTWEDDSPEEIIERLQLLLFEFGVEVALLDEKDDNGVNCKTYRMSEARPI